MDAALWFRDWTTRYGDFPEDYLVIDLESTGSSIDNDLIVQLGWCKVINRQVVNNDGVILNWSNSHYANNKWLRHRLVSTARDMYTKHGLDYPWSYESLSYGMNPITALADFMELLCDVRGSDRLIVAHNGVGFDMPMLTRHFKKFLKIDYEFDSEEVWDTGALEKASQLDEILCDGELPGDFCYRVAIRSGDGVRWSLHDHSIHKYNLASRFNLDLEKSHTAPFDAYVTHLLFEEFRMLSLAGLKRR